ncbi:MAG: indole-3-glycerol phosphate synthase TrpC [Myxococcota bacterium]
MDRVHERRMTDYLTHILARKRRENLRRKRHLLAMTAVERHADPSRSARALAALSRVEGGPAVMAEVKFRSPSAGQIRAWRPGEGVRVASEYEKGGAAVISVLADGPGFGGSPLLVRRVARAVSAPVLFKGFVLDPVQVDLAYDTGASLVLLLVRALSDDTLAQLTSRIQALGMEPVVEAASADEVDRAVALGAKIIGVNARDLETFKVDKDLAQRCVSRIPNDRIAVFMSGVRSPEDYRSVAHGRADAVLVGEGLMRADDPRAQLEAWLRSV